MHDVAPQLEQVFRTEYGKLVAVLTRLLGLSDMTIAEDLVQETLVAAMYTWPQRGVPDNPPAWLMTVARNKALNHLKHSKRAAKAHLRITYEAVSVAIPEVWLPSDIQDSQLRLMFACCHPAVAIEDQVALILRTLGGLGSAEIARALMVTTPTINKRLYRAKKRIRDKAIQLVVPSGDELPPRLLAVCRSLYLLFNEGYCATVGEQLLRRDLCAEAMRLCHLLCQRFDDHPYVDALMALMILHAARFDARVDPSGSSILLQDQDRGKWDRRMIRLGMSYLTKAARGHELSAYHLEASVAAQHCMATDLRSTNWSVIERLYNKLQELRPGPVMRLNLAIVAGQLRGPHAAIDALQALVHDGHLVDYAPLYAAMAHTLCAVHDHDAAERWLQAGIESTTSDRERAYLEACRRDIARTRVGQRA